MEARVSHHARSNSMPNRSHPILFRLKEQMQHFSGSELQAKQFNQSLIDSLVDIYSTLNILLQLPLTQETLRRQDEWVSNIVDDSIKLLDLCNKIRDAIIQVRGQHQGLLSALRRRDHKGLEGQVGGYISSLKKMSKEFAKCIGTLGKTCKPISSCLQSTQESEVVEAITQVRSIAVDVCKSLMLKIGVPMKGQSLLCTLIKPFFAKQVKKGATECDRTLLCLSTSSGKIDEKCLKDAQCRLESLDECLSCVNIALQRINSQLIQTRVTLLNILTN